MTVADYRELIDANARRTGIPAALIAAVIEEESGGQAAVESRMGAVGLMQIVQRVHQGCGTVNELKDPVTNIKCGTEILLNYNIWVCRSLNLPSPNWTDSGVIMRTLGSYNAGPGNVVGIPLPQWPAETKRYVQNVWSLFQSHRDTWQ